MPRSARTLFLVAALSGCGGSTVGDASPAREQPAPASDASPQEASCAKVDVVNETCRLLDATPNFAGQVRAVGVAFQNIAAWRQALRQACHAIAGRLGADVEAALLQPDIAAPICALAATALRGESASFTIKPRATACEEVEQRLCRADQLISLVLCRVEEKVVVEDAARPDLVERLTPSVAQFIEAQDSFSENARRFTELAATVTPPDTTPATACAVTYVSALTASARTVVQDALEAVTALRK